MSELTLGEVGRGLARYRPVALTVGAILLAIAVMPKPDVDLVGSAEPIPGSSSPAVIATTDTLPPPEVIDPAVADPSTTFVPRASSSTFSPPSPSASSTFTTPSEDNGTTFGPSTAPSESNFTFAPTTSSDQPLRIVAKAWASRTAGTPLAADGVPPGSLPVGTRANQDDKLSFVRLSGDETTLRLSEVTTGARATVQGPVKVMACQITASGWKEGEAIAFAAAPADDVTKCVEGVRSPEGVWLFDLAGFATRTDDRGFSLRPGKGAGIDFQVAFKP